MLSRSLTLRSRRSGFSLIESIFMLAAIVVFVFIAAAMAKKRGWILAKPPAAEQSAAGTVPEKADSSKPEAGTPK